MKFKTLSRRSVLRGAGGFALGLPLLEAMVDSKAWAQAAPPKRYLLGFAACSLGSVGSSINQTFVPNVVGPSFDLKAALANLREVKNSVTLVTGLKIPYVRSGAIPPGGRGNGTYHRSQLPGLLSGTGSPDTNFRAPTSDHLAAAVLGGNPQFRTLPVTGQASGYYRTSALGTGYPISYKQDANGAIQPVPPYYSPQQLFQMLFGSLPTGGMTSDQVARQQWQLNQRKSVLDGVLSRMTKVEDQLGMVDRRRLDNHLQEFRELELRVAAVPPPVASVATCVRPMDPGPDPALSGSFQPTPGGLTYNQNIAYGGEEQRTKAMCDLIHMALVCDRTRSVTFRITSEQSLLNMYQLTGDRSTLHELSHGGGGADCTVALSRAINWHMKHWAYLLGKLKASSEGTGSVLDNMAAVLTWEGGQGRDDTPEGGGRAISPHSTDNMAMLIAGGAGGLKQGLHIKAPGLHPAQVVYTALKAIGYTGSKFGEIGGEIPGLR